MNAKIVETLKACAKKFESLTSGCFFEIAEEKPGVAYMFGERLESLRCVEGRQSSYGKAKDAWEWTKDSGPVLIEPDNEPNPHILVVGMSGFGKSTLCKSLILEICRAGKKIMVFDVHNEHTDAIKSVGGEVRNALYSGINLLALDGMTVSERVDGLVDLFAEVYRLGGIQIAKLGECLKYTYRRFGAQGENAVSLEKTPTMDDLIDELSVFIMHSKTSTERDGLLNLRTKLRPLNTAAFNKNFVTLEQLRGSVMSFSLARLKSKEARAIYINELLKRLYLTMKDNTREQGIRHYIMIDEAQFLLGNGSMAGELIKRLIEEGRKYGVGLIVATHSASALDKQIVANASTFISFYSREPDEVEYVSKLLSNGNREMAEAVKSRMLQMKQHEALVASGSIGTPLLVRTLSAAEVILQLDNDKLAEAAEKELKQDIVAFALRPVSNKMLCEKFGAKAEASALDLISTGELGIMTWKPTADEKDNETWYMMKNGGLSIQHEVFVRKISEGLSLHGIKNVTTLQGSDKPDIIAFTKAGNAAVEYETGNKKSSIPTKVMLERRIKNYSAVYVFVADDHYERYCRNFAQDKLHIVKFCDLDSVAKALLDLEPVAAQHNNLKEAPT